MYKPLDDYRTEFPEIFLSGFLFSYGIYIYIYVYKYTHAITNACVYSNMSFEMKKEDKINRTLFLERVKAR